MRVGRGKASPRVPGDAQNASRGVVAGRDRVERARMRDGDELGEREIQDGDDGGGEARRPAEAGRAGGAAEPAGRIKVRGPVNKAETRQPAKRTGEPA